MKIGRIYLDNCVTSKTAPEVLKEMQRYFEEKYWFPGTFISTGESANEQISHSQQIVAESMGAKASEIHFTSGGTLANNIAIKGLANAYKKQGNHIIVSVVDYPDLLTNAAYLEKNGFEVTYLSADNEGYFTNRIAKRHSQRDNFIYDNRCESYCGNNSALAGNKKGLGKC